jgi:chromosome transmission fidelity protein 8
MPTVPLYLPNKDRGASVAAQALPQLLQTPSGLAIVEIQGTVNAPTNDSAPIGKLMFPHYDSQNPTEDTSWQKRVYLYVGKHQRLTGEVKKLAKPLAVVRRQEFQTAIQGTSNNTDDALEIAEIVYYKILFSSRPEPVGGD